jgi:hypothetical protein
MPVFDRSTSEFHRVEAELLRGVLGPAKRGATAFQLASRDYRRRQQQAAVRRALVVIVLVGAFCGSALMMSETRRPAPKAAPILLSSPSGALFPAREPTTASAPVEGVPRRH